MFAMNEILNTTPTLVLGMTTMGVFLSIAIVIIALLLIGLILLQKNRGAGLSGAFGGVGGHSAFGTKTGDFLTWVTVGLVTVFLLLNIAGNYIFEPAKITAAQKEDEDTDAADEVAPPIDLTQTPAPSGTGQPIKLEPTTPPPNVVMPSTKATPMPVTPTVTPTPVPVTPAPKTPGGGDAGKSAGTESSDATGGG
ncbi:MAG: preprotein translocase subunit SecG [Phycisphaerae bacterium]